MNHSDAIAFVICSILKSITNDTLGRVSSDQLDRLNDSFRDLARLNIKVSGNGTPGRNRQKEPNLVFNTAVFTFRVLTNNNSVHIIIERLVALDASTRSHIRIETKSSARIAVRLQNRTRSSITNLRRVKLSET